MYRVQGPTYFFLFRVFFLDARLKSTYSCTPLILVLLKKKQEFRFRRGTFHEPNLIRIKADTNYLDCLN